jgi:hypothetical protein
VLGLVSLTVHSENDKTFMSRCCGYAESIVVVLARHGALSKARDFLNQPLSMREWSGSVASSHDFVGHVRSGSLEQLCSYLPRLLCRSRYERLVLMIVRR